jgi:hypothetical protein
MNDVSSRYDSLLKQIAAIYPDDPTLQSHLQTAKVISEKWDDGHGGGHLRFETSPSAPILACDTVDAWTEDTDGMYIEVILHLMNGASNLVNGIGSTARRLSAGRLNQFVETFDTVIHGFQVGKLPSTGPSIIYE